MAALLVITSLLPLAVAAYLDIRDARQSLSKGDEALLAARAEHLTDQLDTFNQNYQTTVLRTARSPLIARILQQNTPESVKLRSEIQSGYKASLATDPNVRGIGLMDPNGKVEMASEPKLVGRDLSNSRDVRRAISGNIVISDVQVVDFPSGSSPVITHLAPIIGAGNRRIGIAVLWVKASAMWEIMKEANGLAGKDSFAVLFDSEGIRVGHTYSNDIVFHPGGVLAPSVIKALSDESRFGTQTRSLLQDVRSFPAQFRLAKSPAPDKALFRGWAPVNSKFNLGVARRLDTVPWTLFYMVPEDSIDAVLGHLTQQKAAFAGVIMLVALLGGAFFTAIILRPIRTLSKTAEALAGGDLSARTTEVRGDELGKLGSQFNFMADALQKERDGLELRVRERTADLVTSQERIRLIIESALDAVISIDESGMVLGWNAQAEAIFGWTADQTIGRLAAELIIPERFREAHSHGISRYLETGEAVVLNKRIELTALHESGHEFPVELSITPIRTGEGITFSAFVRDITERKNSESKIQAQLARLDLLGRITRAIAERQDLSSVYQVVIRTLEDHLPIDFTCVCLYDPHESTLKVVSVGVRSEELATNLAMTANSRIPIDQNGLSQCVRGSLVYEPNLTQLEFPFPQRLAKGGIGCFVAAPLLFESKVFGVLIAARREADGFSSGECEFLRQLCEHVALAAHQADLHGALQQAYDDLRQTQQAILQQERLRALGQMASGIAHDINNAISPVALYTESLLENEPNLSDRAKGYLETIARSIDDVAATVSRMREFYRQREPQLSLAPVQLNDLVPEVIDLTRARWNDMSLQRGVVISLDTELAQDVPPILGVKSEIRELLTNLVFNAVDAMPDGGKITLRTKVSQDDHRVLLEVSDTGIGMDEETQRRCLEPFFTTKGERGTGLGLAMVYGIVQRHGGDMHIESEPGKGTTFTLSFSEPDKQLLSDERPYVSRRVTERLRILLIDDDPLLLKSLRDTLETDGHAVTIANGGQAGVDAFRATSGTPEAFSVVITDLGMPTLDGRKVVSAIKEISSDVYVILLTGWGQRLIAEGDVPAGVDQVLNKPPKLRELRDALASSVERGEE